MVDTLIYTKKSRTYGLIGTAVLVGALMLFFILFIIRTPNPPYPEPEDSASSGIEVMLGFSDAGLDGSIGGAQTPPPTPSESTPQPTSSSSPADNSPADDGEEEPILTQDSEDAPAVVKKPEVKKVVKKKEEPKKTVVKKPAEQKVVKKVEKPQPTAEEIAQQEELKQQKLEEQRILKEKQEKERLAKEAALLKQKQEEEARKLKEQQAAVARGMVKGGLSNKSGSGNSQGEAGGTGLQGNPNGDPNATGYTGNGGTGGGTGNGIGGTGKSGSGKGNGFSLSGRSLVGALPKPTYNIQEEGIVVIEITVDKYGKVTAAEPILKGSTTQNPQLQKFAKEAALKAKFNEALSGSAFQKGTITYTFKLN